MMVYEFEVVGLIFVFVMLYFTYLEYKRSRLTKLGFTFWFVSWIFSFLLIVFHEYINEILPEIRLIRVLDLYMILAFMFLFGIVFYLFVVIKHIEKRIENIIRTLALKPVKPKLK